jgi:hypothetical protein
LPSLNQAKLRLEFFFYQSNQIKSLSLIDLIGLGLIYECFFWCFGEVIHVAWMSG